MASKAWFETWFDSSYYHLLYKDRDDSEAERFIGNLIHYLQLPESVCVLDLACGKGRHSVTLASHGFDVTGVDLSPNSIASARKMETEKLTFEVQDMRFPFAEEKFDAIFNLFTSFGYFDDLNDNLKVIQSIKKMLKPEGILVIDFMNAERVVANLVSSEVKNVEGVTFHINREYNGTHIFKHIRFQAEGEEFQFTERVQALKADDFEMLLKSEGFEIIRTFGNFDLNDFNANNSDRLILIARRS